MTLIKYYDRNDKLVEKELDKDAKIKGFTVTEYSSDLNDRIDNVSFRYIDSNITEVKSLQEAVNIYKQKFNEYEKKSFDWKGYSIGCLKFYWNNGKTEVMTYVKLNYKGNEIIELNLEELGF